MKKIVLPLIFIILLLLSNSLSAFTGGVVCSTSDPTKISLKEHNFVNTGQESYFIKLTNNTGGNITIISVESKSSILGIEKAPEGIINSKEEFQIDSRLPSEIDILNSEQILMKYTDLAGNGKNVTITCSGSLGSTLESYVFLQWIGNIFGLLSYLFLLLGVIFIGYGHLKRKHKLKLLGPWLIVLAIICFLISFFL